ncbi:DUF1402 family protein [Agrobacterium sp. O3.4]|uniref:DUF1402 family protein n=2 Tax=Rhizobium/Agrobacterium group TaxID=227290 RepID=A0A546XAX0_RHIRH|nr:MULTISPECIES: DUF1402 family protein [Rhizobium/Agrobacterium group]MCZ7471588.1 DUF1402 family protein [Rhizobium rhizogenes]TRA97899.1 DUF1402 family protein [Rhizobium rhizogenes]WHO11076.1 DUF1402 family protein [Agrobacterium cucumeris]
MSLFAKITRTATVIMTLACLPSYAVAQQMTVVPPGNRSAEQPEIPRASAIRTKAFYTTYEEKFGKTINLLNSEPALLSKIRKAAAAYGIDPIHIVGAIVGEHTFNVSAVDRLQTYYVKAISYAELDIKFSYNGVSLKSFLQRPEFRSCEPLATTSEQWSCRDTVWDEDFRGKVVDGASYEAISFQRAFFQPFYAGQTFGLGQISPLTALQVSDLVNKTSGLPKLSADRPKEIYRDVMDPDRSIIYIAAIIRDSIDAYREKGFDISGNPGITATLYNVGQPRRRAERLRVAVDAGAKTRLPVENYYGWLINDRLAILKNILDGKGVDQRTTSDIGEKTR